MVATRQPFGAWTGSQDIPPPVFIGDELSAAGYRLGGAQTYTPTPEDLLPLFHRVLQESALILISVEYARQMPPEELRQALLSLKPLVLVVPDIRNRFAMRDVAVRLRRLLGVSP